MRLPVRDAVRMAPRRQCPVCGLWFSQSEGVYQEGSFVHSECYDEQTVANTLPGVRPPRLRPVLGTGTADTSTPATPITYPTTVNED